MTAEVRQVEQETQIEFHEMPLMPAGIPAGIKGSYFKIRHRDRCWYICREYDVPLPRPVRLDGNEAIAKLEERLALATSRAQTPP